MKFRAKSIMKYFFYDRFKIEYNLIKFNFDFELICTFDSMTNNNIN